MYCSGRIGGRHGFAVVRTRANGVYNRRGWRAAQSAIDGARAITGTLDRLNRKRPVIGEQLRPIATRLKGARLLTWLNVKAFGQLKTDHDVAPEMAGRCSGCRA